MVTSKNKPAIILMLKHWRLYIVTYFFLLITSCEKDEPLQSTDLNKDFYISNTALKINNYSKDIIFYIQNNYRDSYNFDILFDTSLFYISPDKLVLEPYGKEEVSVIPKELAFNNDTTLTSIYIQSTDIFEDTLEVEIVNYNFNTTYFNYDILDAEYCSSNNSIVCISSNPQNALYTYNLDSEEWNTILLDESPNCLSLSPINAYAALGFNNKVSLIDLESLEVTNEYKIDDQCFDIVFSSSGWVYGFCYPGIHTTNYYSINSNSNGVKKLSITHHISESRVKIQPGEKYIYGVWASVYASEVTYKFYIGNDTLELTGSNSHDYNLDHDFWFSTNGNNLFAKSGKVFSTSRDKDLNLSQIGVLEGINRILYLEHDDNKNRTYSINEFLKNWFDDSMSTELICHDGNFNRISKIPTNKFSRPDSNGKIVFFNSNLKYLFLDKDYSNLYIIADVIEGSGLDLRWSIQKIVL